MKTFLILLTSLIAFGASAATVAQLPIPTGVVGQLKSCAAVGFTNDGGVVETCRGVTSAPCSGRGCQPVQTIVTYGVVDNIVFACKSVRHHLPQPDVVTYAPGYDAASCPDPIATSTGIVTVINGVPYWFVATDDITGVQLVNSASAAFLVVP